jgi:uncharacterized protein (DUF305 family)
MNPRPSATPLGERARALGVTLLVVAVAAAALTALVPRATATAGEPRRPASVAPTGEETFASLMDQAMERMHAGMSVAPTGDPDRDFARMMIPHHQGAVDMALVELRFGKDERLRRLAQGIIVEQRQEIALMQSILDGRPRGDTPSK